MHPKSLNSDQVPVNPDDEDVFAAFTHIGVDIDNKLTPRDEDATGAASIPWTDLPDFEHSHANPNGETNTSIFTPTGSLNNSLLSWNALEPTLCSAGGPEHSEIRTSLAFSFDEQAPQQNLTHESTCHAVVMVPAAIPPTWGSGILWCDECNSNRALDNDHQELLVWLMRQLGFDDEESKWGIFQNHIAKKSGVMVVVDGANNQQAVASFIALCCYACYNQHRCSCLEVEKMKTNGFICNRFARRTINECYKAILEINDSKWKCPLEQALPPTSKQSERLDCTVLSAYSPEDSMGVPITDYTSRPFTDGDFDGGSSSLGRNASRPDANTYFVTYRS